MSPVLVGTSHHHISSSTATAPLLTPASTLNCLLEKASSQISVTLFFVTQKHVKTAAEIFLSQGGLLHLCWGKKKSSADFIKKQLEVRKNRNFHCP